MNGWKETTLAEICTDISYGYTESASTEEIGPKFLRITDIANGRLLWENVPFCRITESNFEKYRLHPGDIVIARTGATTGANYTVKFGDPKNVVYASYLIRYQINNEKAFPFYIGQILRSSSWKNYVSAIAGGSAQPGANARQLGSFEINLPPLPEQKAIAEVLSSLDDKIDLLHRQNKTLEQMAETLFRQWFVEEVNGDWEETTLGNLIKIGSGKGLKKDQFVDNGKYPILGANGEIGRTNEYLFDNKLIFTGRVGTLGNVFRIENEKVWLSDNTLVIHPQKYYNYIYFILKNAKLSRYNVGSTQPLVRQSDIKEIDIFIFDKNIHLEFEKQSDLFFNKIKSNQTQIRTLEKMRDTLLPKLMSGEVRVNSEKLKVISDK